MNPSIRSSVLRELYDQAKLDWLDLGLIYGALQDHLDFSTLTEKEKIDQILFVFGLLLKSGDFQVIRMNSNSESGFDVFDETPNQTLERVREDCLIYGLDSCWFSGLLKLRNCLNFDTQLP